MKNECGYIIFPPNVQTLKNTVIPLFTQVLFWDAIGCQIIWTLLGEPKLSETQVKYFIEYNINILWVCRIVSYESVLLFSAKIGTKLKINWNKHKSISLS